MDYDPGSDPNREPYVLEMSFNVLGKEFKHILHEVRQRCEQIKDTPYLGVVWTFEGCFSGIWIGKFYVILQSNHAAMLKLADVAPIRKLSEIL